MIPKSPVTTEWYTPAIYLNAARSVLGAFDLDPASCELANIRVNAKTYYEVDGLKERWFGRVWLNPPYGKGLKLWVDKLVDEYESWAVPEAILLTNANTEASWFQPLWKYTKCFTDHRIRFIDQQGVQQSSPTRGNVFTYFGAHQDRFSEAFRQFGAIVNP